MHRHRSYRLLKFLFVYLFLFNLTDSGMQGSSEEKSSGENDVNQKEMDRMFVEYEEKQGTSIIWTVGIL